MKVNGQFRLKIVFTNRAIAKETIEEVFGKTEYDINYLEKKSNVV
jgi:hypothetical protein